MGGKGGGSKDQVVQQKPWKHQKQHLKALYRGAEALPLQEYYPGETVVPFSPQTEQALGLQEQRAIGGSPLLPAAQMENLLTTTGGYLDIANTPGFQRAFEAAQRDISPYIQGQAEMAGRYAGGLPQEAEMRALGDAFASQWAPLYEAERGRMMGASLAAPALSQSDYFDIGQLGMVGAEREAQQAREIQDAMTRWEFAQSAPYNQLAFRSGIVQSGYPGGSTTRPLYGQSPLAGAIGGGLAGLGAMQGIAGLTGGSIPAFSPLVSALGPGLGAAASWALPAAALGYAATK